MSGVEVIFILHLNIFFSGKELHIQSSYASIMLRKIFRHKLRKYCVDFHKNSNISLFRAQKFESCILWHDIGEASLAD